MELTRVRALSVMAGMVLAGCSGVEIKQEQELLPSPPDYAFVAHPSGFGASDLEALFLDSRVQRPSAEVLKACDSDFRKLRAATRSAEEFTMGAREFVRLEPVHHHWCFYSTLLDLELSLKREDLYLEDRQKKVVSAFVYLSPIARAFFSEYRDSRYWRWAIHRYRLLSETVLYRRLEPSPETTLDLVSASEPMGGLRKVPLPPTGRNEGAFILEKYGIRTATTQAVAVPTAGPPAIEEVPAAKEEEEPEIPLVTGVTEQPSTEKSSDAPVGTQFPATEESGASAPDAVEDVPQELSN